MLKGEIHILSKLICDSRFSRKQFFTNGIIQQLKWDYDNEVYKIDNSKNSLEYKNEGQPDWHSTGVFWPMFDFNDKSIKYVRLTKTRISFYSTSITLGRRIDTKGDFYIIKKIKCPSNNTDKKNLIVSIEYCQNTIELGFYFDGEKYNIISIDYGEKGGIDRQTLKNLLSDENVIDQIFTNCFRTISIYSLTSKKLKGNKNPLHIFIKDYKDHSFLVKYDWHINFYQRLKNEICNQVISESKENFNKILNNNNLPIWYKLRLLSKNEWLGLTRYCDYNNYQTKKGIKGELSIFLLECGKYIRDKIKYPTKEFFDYHLQDFNFEISTTEKTTLFGLVVEIWFLKINENKLQFETDEISKVKALVKFFIETLSIEDEIKILSQDLFELEWLESVSLNFPKSKVNLEIDIDFRDSLILRYKLHDPIINYISTTLNLSEDESRKKYIDLIYEISYQIDCISNPIKISIAMIYDMLFENTKKIDKKGDKQKVYDFLHSILEPFFPQLNLKEEQDEVRGISSEAKKTHDQHIRDFIDGLMK